MQLSDHGKIRWAIIGLGHIANVFATDLLKVENAELYAVASRSQKKANEFAKKFHANKAYDSYQALAEDPNIDAVYIATPHALHKENTLLCLRHGIAVLCEKPFAMNSKEVEQMISVAQENNTLLMEALWTYFLPHYNFVLETLQNQTYGKLVKLEANFGFTREFTEDSRLFNKALGGGSLLDIGIYPVFAALSTLGVPEKIFATATFFENGADSSCSMKFNYPNNITASLDASLLESTSCEALFYCEQAIIRIDAGFHGPATVTVIKDNNQETLDFGYHTNGYNYEIDHFNQLLRQQKTESDVMTFNFSRELIKTLDTVSDLIGLKYQ